eukprot:TRINITY_DN2501_c0_g3_i2.p1 TRINITY_DN2501_c0_g3~~TRINITY_DN2501_c0_g3_i2.p1  ORF type:complete len:144 (-),score=16.29 TRINITY_DN2501_c0_g3_i2:67-498(-)
MCIRDRYQRRVHGEDCANRTEKRVNNPDRWLSAFFACLVCHPEYRKHPVLPKKVCQGASDDCKKLALHTPLENRPKALNSCAEVTLKGCEESVSKNPACWALCLDDCHQETYEGMKLEEWLTCRKECEYCNDSRRQYKDDILS